MTAPRWYVVRDDMCSYEIDDPEAEVWTLSLDPNETGWCTDSGYGGYGLTKALAEELASAANAAYASKEVPQRGDFAPDLKYQGPSFTEEEWRRLNRGPDTYFGRTQEFAPRPEPWDTELGRQINRDPKEP